jgi:hypothetical protein
MYSLTLTRGIVVTIISLFATAILITACGPTDPTRCQGSSEHVKIKTPVGEHEDLDACLIIPDYAEGNSPCRRFYHRGEPQYPRTVCGDFTIEVIP